MIDWMGAYINLWYCLTHRCLADMLKDDEGSPEFVACVEQAASEFMLPDCDIKGPWGIEILAKDLPI